MNSVFNAQSGKRNTMATRPLKRAEGGQTSPFDRPPTGLSPNYFGKQADLSSVQQNMFSSFPAFQSSAEVVRESDQEDMSSMQSRPAEDQQRASELSAHMRYPSDLSPFDKQTRTSKASERYLGVSDNSSLRSNDLTPEQTRLSHLLDKDTSIYLQRRE